MTAGVVPSLVELIDEAIENATVDGMRKHLGASLIGRACEREIFYTFRWAARATFPGRMLRLFRRGSNEEAVFVEDLRRLGATVVDRDPKDPEQQIRVSALDQHFGGSLDAVAYRVPGFPPDEWILLEFKTHNQKSFDDLITRGVHQSKRAHYAQMQIYMGLLNLRWAGYFAVNKNTDALHVEAIAFDPLAFEQLMEKAIRIIFARSAPRRISNSPAYFECKYCTFKHICHFNAPPVKSCRSCRNATPTKQGQWHCGHWNEIIPDSFISKGCALYNPLHD